MIPIYPIYLNIHQHPVIPKEMFRLFDFNIMDKMPESYEDQSDADSETDAYTGGNEGEEGPPSSSSTLTDQFIIQMFGVNEVGETCSIFVSDYRPFFYVLVTDSWSISTKTAFVTHLKKRIGKYYQNGILDAKLIKRKKLYGFDNGKEYKFVCIMFDNIRTFNKVKDLWY